MVFKRYYLVASILFCSPAIAQQEFSVYCTSNMDGTGKCKRTDRDEDLRCIIIPGGVIACKDGSESKYECVQYGAVNANQTQFSCVPDSDNSIDPHIFDDTQNSVNKDNGASDGLPEASTKMPSTLYPGDISGDQLNNSNDANKVKGSPYPDDEFYDVF